MTLEEHRKIFELRKKLTILQLKLNAINMEIVDIKAELTTAFELDVDMDAQISMTISYSESPSQTQEDSDNLFFGSDTGCRS